MAEVDPGVAEADSCECGGEEHGGLGFGVGRVAHGAGEVADGLPQGLEAEDVGDGVRPLVRRAVDRVRGARGALRVWDRGPGFERVAEHVETAAGVHGGWHGGCV